MASSSSSSSSVPCVSKYDVFLSFRGEDTRKTIVSHLYAALDSRGIVTFKDDQRLETGDHISDQLHIALKGSSFAVVVLSENYATSKWCLMELQLIMEFMKEGTLEVFPIFYGVDPSTVRHQLRSFSLERYKGRPEMVDKVHKWKEALHLIANLSGVDSRHCVDEAVMVGEIARDISRRVTLMQKIDSGNIVGMKAHMEGLNHLLDLESNEVVMLGIWGMGGIGKSSIAKCLYDQISPRFRARCFLENIKSVSKDHDHDLKHFQKEMLSTILCDDISLWSVEAGCQEIKKRLGHQKVFLVLDGVYKVAQVHALAKEKNWFGPGSRIIITTRDMGLLNTCGVENVYEVKCLSDKDALKMFKQIAFEGGGSPPCAGLEQLSVRATRLAHGLPSAINAHALFLRGRTVSPEVWEEALTALESSLDENTMEILRISYEGLPKPHQNVFLHVACLFNGDTLQRITSLLHGPIPQSSLWIRVLAEKSLIKISTNGSVIMHKLVEQMAREMIRDDRSLARKFLRDSQDVFYALTFRDRGEQTECMSLHTCDMTCALSMKASVVGHMHNLKFLKVYKHVDSIESKLQLIPDQHLLPCSLRLFHWDAFPLRTLPPDADPYFLVELNLRHSDLETLWSGKPMFNSLKRLDVTGSKHLKQLPDLSGITSLEELFLEHCPRLKGIPESIGKRSTLKKLKLSYCGGLRSALRFFIWKSTMQQHIGLEFPDAKVKMDALINISIGGDISFEFCSKFRGNAEYISFNSDPQISATSSMNLQQAPWLISECNRFNSLSIMRFSHKENGESFSFDSFPDFPDLKELKLVNLNIRKIPSGVHGIQKLEFLEKLDLSGNDFENLPEAMNGLSRLKSLWLQNCFKLKELPKLTQVQTLTLTNCRNLRSLVKLSDTSEEKRRYSLLELCLENCNNVELLSDQLSHFTKLTNLDLSGHDFDTLPSSIRDITSLVTLCLNNCKKIKSVEKLPPSLQFLDAHGCHSLEADSVEHFRDKPYEEVQQGTCFKETEMPIYVLNHQATSAFQIIHLLKKTPAPMFLGIPFCITLVAVLVVLLLRVFK
ncbi:Disease resistance protein (TIR-NBS-LRR class) family [Raphanus sativus]|uniref:Disease resistance protein RML1B n=1 Tax=Raphanus sativus TaxID=3726 RepID=A0A6J0NJ85_RAPSA|nr:disease resistance protein RML1B [Raphanus sativus]KAJ4901474.1 Disease resistance protein (TIR-NBS-LRR class) family [Raphanus sativus]